MQRILLAVPALVALLVSFAISDVLAQVTGCEDAPASLLNSASTWSGASIGLNVCGRLCVIQQNCYNCMSTNPLTDRACICSASENFFNDVTGCQDGSGAPCAGQSDIVTRYYNSFCGKSVSVGPTSAASTRTTTSAAAVATTIVSTVRAATTTTTPLATSRIVTTTARVSTTRTSAVVTLKAASSVNVLPTATFGAASASTTTVTASAAPHTVKFTFGSIVSTFVVAAAACFFFAM